MVAVGVRVTDLQDCDATGALHLPCVSGKLQLAPLRAGDTVAVISPFGRPSPELAKGIEVIESLGLVVSRPDLQAVKDNATAGRSALGYTAYSRDEAARVLHECFEDPKIRAVLISNPRQGVEDLIELLDFGRISGFPKPIVGYGNIAPLLSTIALRCGFPTFYGPLVDKDLSHFGEDSQFNREQLRSVLFGVLSDAQIFKCTSLNGDVGEIYGPSLTMNIRLLASFAGRDEFPDVRGKILLLEEECELPRRIHQDLNQIERYLLASNNMPKAIVFGNFPLCFETDQVHQDVTVASEIGHWLRKSNLRCPVVKLAEDAWIGQDLRKRTVPIGGPAQLTSSSLTIHTAVMSELMFGTLR